MFYKNAYLFGNVDYLLGEIVMPVIDGNIFNGIQSKTGDSIYYKLSDGTSVKTVNLNYIVRNLLSELYSDNKDIDLTQDYQYIDKTWITPYQKELGLTVDGIIGPKTSAALWDSLDAGGQSKIKQAIKLFVDEINSNIKTKDIITENIKEDKKESFFNKYGSYVILGVSGLAAIVLLTSLFAKEKKGK